MKIIRGRIAVVTGAASGIGRATALELVKAGCHVALVDVDEIGMTETLRIAQSIGGTVTTHVVDVADREQVRALADDVTDQHGAVHVLINNAGVGGGGAFSTHDLDDFERVMRVNFWGVVHGCKYFLPHLKRQPEAHIVNVSSMLGLVGFPLVSSYCASKFAVRGFSEALWLELRNENIGVTTIHPGLIRTNIARAALGEGTRAELDVMTRFIEHMDKRGMAPERVAKRIIDAIRRDHVRILINRETFVIDWLQRISPGTTRRLLSLAAARGRLRAAIGN